jgi:iron(II)-dependent oxidoreductase
MQNTIRPWWRRWTRRFRQEDRASTETKTVHRDTGREEADERDGGSKPDARSRVETFLAQERYCLLLRAQLCATLPAEYARQARDALERSMAKIPGGMVDLAEREQESETAGQILKEVEPLLLDRYPVTNRQFQQFVEAGGYEMAALWNEEAKAAIVDFHDVTGAPGPRFWQSGKYASGQGDHPVVGVSWFECAAYARWSGKRLPSEAEWLRAAAWPIPMGDGKLAQRRFPWGDVMDRGRCNVWGSGPGQTAEVRQFSSGVSVSGVYQLIGNVWEWTGGDFDAVDADGVALELPGPMKSIRGGAFDTYFEQQACCSFRSGELPLARKHNIGFRCALSVCDVANSGDER